MTGFKKKAWWVLLTTAVVASLSVTAAPAVADVRDVAKSGDACWVDLDEGGAAQCFDDAAELADAVLDQTGAVVVREGSQVAARGGVGVLAVYAVVDFYTGSSYTGTTYTYTSSSSTVCSGAGIKEGDLIGGANNSISSWHAYYGCAARVFDLADQMGDQYGSYINAATIGGGMGNRASSYRLT